MASFKTLTLTSLGAGLEYFDFVIFALFANTIGLNFFPTTQSWIATLNAFTVFAVGYLLRPLGGFLFGCRGDRHGRKHTFVIAMMLMAFATLSIGLLPNYTMIGLAAPIGLVILRIIQGISFGAELPGAITFICEHSHAPDRSQASSWIFFGVSTGVTFAFLLSYCLNHWLTATQLQTYGWRIPFLLGGLLAVAGYFLRKSTPESPLFNKADAPLSTLLLVKELWLSHCGSLIRGFLIAVCAAIYIIFYLFLPSILPQKTPYLAEDIFLTSMLGLVCSTFLIPIFGRIADLLGAKRQYIVSLFLALLTTSLFWQHLANGGWWLLLAFMLIYQTGVAAITGAYPTLLAETFPTRVRYTGVAICYNLAFAVAGFTPVVATWLFNTRLTH